MVIVMEGEEEVEEVKVTTKGLVVPPPPFPPVDCEGEDEGEKLPPFPPPTLPLLSVPAEVLVGGKE